MRSPSSGLRSDLPALLDEWAGSLFRELDYRREAANGTRFKVLRCLSESDRRQQTPWWHTAPGHNRQNTGLRSNSGRRS